TTVAGNQTLEKTTANALKLLEFTGRTDIPVAAGAARPLVRNPYVAAYVHGETGMDGPELPLPQTQPVAGHAVDFLAAQLLGSAGPGRAPRLGAARLLPAVPFEPVRLGRLADPRRRRRRPRRPAGPRPDG